MYAEIPTGTGANIFAMAAIALAFSSPVFLQVPERNPDIKRTTSESKASKKALRAMPPTTTAITHLGTFTRVTKVTCGVRISAGSGSSRMDTVDTAVSNTRLHTR